MATSSRSADRAGPSPAQLLGAGCVGEDGALPLPWLQTPLQQAATLDRVHALLLHGPEGAGHLALARVLAQRRLCESVPAGAPLPARPCGRCAACHLVQQRSHPDLLLVLPEALRHRLGWVGEDEPRGKSDAKPSKDLRIEQVRQAIAWAHQTSSRGRGKLLLLHPADALNGPSANALLKTLEEPAAGLQILLTSHDPERLLPTVRSRCQRLALALPAAEAARGWLAQQGLAAPEALLAATGGSPLQALQWAEDGIDAALLKALPRRVAVGDAAALAGQALPRVLDLLLKLVHDALALAVGGRPHFLAASDWPPTPAQALPALLDWQRELLRAARHDEHPWNAPLLLEALLVPAAHCWPASTGARRR